MRVQKSLAGTRIYNYGDIANQPHWGVVTNVITNETFGNQLVITPDTGTDSDTEVYIIPMHMLSYIDMGNGSTKIVTEEAHLRLCKIFS